MKSWQRSSRSPLPLSASLGSARPWAPLALKIRPELTSLAAAGLTIIMIGAAGTVFAVGGGAMAVMPLLIGAVTALIAYNRRPANLALRQQTPNFVPAS